MDLLVFCSTSLEEAEKGIFCLVEESLSVAGASLDTSAYQSSVASISYNCHHSWMDNELFSFVRRQTAYLASIAAVVRKQSQIKFACFSKERAQLGNSKRNFEQINTYRSYLWCQEFVREFKPMA